MVVEGWLARAARARPAHTALQTPLGSWSYAELLAAARLGARELAGHGVRPGQRVGIALAPGLAFAQALHACLELGAVAVPVDPRSSSVERARIAEGTTVLLDAPLAVGEGPGNEKPAVRHDLDAVAVVIHTSGTTSSPRPVELTYGNLLWSALGSAVAIGRDPDERWLCTLPVSHIGGLSILVRSAIYATTAVVHERFETDRAVRSLREDEITLVSLVATTLARLLDAGFAAPPALRCALTGGGPVPRALVQEAHAARVPVSLTYGLTEASSQVATTPVATIGSASGDRAPIEVGAPSAGPPLFCARVRITSAGEIVVRGPTVAPGALSSDGWLHTGDLGSLDEDGRLIVVGRTADTIVTGGENVAPAEVEAVLESHPDVLEAAVVGLEDPQWGEVVTAIVVTRPGSVIESDVLREHCARALASYKIPKRIVPTSEPLARTPSGKLLRGALR